jgi:hypothetical protein
MARIVYTIGEIFGSIGGLTFQRNHSGKIVRFRPTVGKKSTSKQQRAHLIHNDLLRGWMLLTNAQKDLWNTYASTWVKVNKFGQDKTLTGANWYESLNYFREILSLSYFTVPPAHDLPTSPPTFEILLASDSVKINFTSAHDYVDSPVIVWVTLPTRKISNSVNQIRKYALVISAAPSDPLDITTEWETATGLDWNPTANFPNANIFVCLESVKASSGITSPMICGKKSTSEITEDETMIYYS